MGVYIKDMEMPTEGTIIAVYKIDGKLYATRGLSGRLCPLIPTPPHGRLIDADALVNKHFGKEFLSNVMTADKNELGTALVNIPLVINNVSAIIQAEEGE